MLTSKVGSSYFSLVREILYDLHIMKELKWHDTVHAWEYKIK